MLTIIDKEGKPVMIVEDNATKPKMIEDDEQDSEQEDVTVRRTKRKKKVKEKTNKQKNKEN